MLKNLKEKKMKKYKVRIYRITLNIKFKDIEKRSKQTNLVQNNLYSEIGNEKFDTQVKS